MIYKTFTSATTIKWEIIKWPKSYTYLQKHTDSVLSREKKLGFELVSVVRPA